MLTKENPPTPNEEATWYRKWLRIAIGNTTSNLTVMNKVDHVLKDLPETEKSTEMMFRYLSRQVTVLFYLAIQESFAMRIRAHSSDLVQMSRGAGSGAARLQLWFPLLAGAFFLAGSTGSPTASAGANTADKPAEKKNNGIFSGIIDSRWRRGNKKETTKTKQKLQTTRACPQQVNRAQVPTE